MSTRRHFIQQTALAGMIFTVPEGLSLRMREDKLFSYQSDYLNLELNTDYPEFSYFSTDSLGKKQFSVSPLLITERQVKTKHKSKIIKNGITWFLQQTPVWECKMAPRSITFQTHWKDGIDSDPFDITFSQRANHCTVLGVMEEENKIQFPCILHFPGMGTFRVYCSAPDVSLFYDANRDVKEPFVKIQMEAANSAHPNITYRFDSVAIYPDYKKIKNDDRFDGFKKNYINIFQMNPHYRALANNSASDVVTFATYFYAEMARQTPELVNGLTAMDLVRNTLNRYLGSMKGYGLVGYPAWQSKYDSLDSLPSLIITACYYILSTNDLRWGRDNYNGIKQWAKRMRAMDRNHDGIIEYGYSGNSGSWVSRKDKNFRRPANWWDTIGFGHDDAYSNALAYKACTLFTDVAKKLNKENDYLYFDNFAKKLKSNYLSTFYNTETKVLGGWRSTDGELHDYYFTFVNSVAICYDLIDKEPGKNIMLTMLAKMSEAGYRDFSLGLPGNLIPIADADYVDKNPRWGYQNFQAYENGGATGCYVYFTIQALLKLGMRKEAEKILFPMLESYKEGNFSGNCTRSEKTRDWKTWEGECWGYEGFLVENYLALLSVDDYLNE